MRYLVFMRTSLLAASFVLASCAGSSAPATTASPAAPPAAPSSTPAAAASSAPSTPSTPSGPVKAGDRAPTFSLPVAGEGREVALADALAKNKLTVLLFVATQCPVSNAYNTRMAEIAATYAAKGVGFYGVNSNKQESVEEIVAHAKEHGFSFPVLKDAGNRVADLYGARVTPEVYVVDPQGVVRYHGRIDEQQADPAAVKSPDLRDALDALLQGAAPKNPETKAFGCSIKRV